MLTRKVFRLKSSTLGIEDQKEQRAAVMVPVGEIVRVLSGPCPDDSQLVDLLWRGRYLVMFAEDVEARGEEIQVRQQVQAASGGGTVRKISVSR